MPRQKDLKRLVRSRMQKTGESYTAARAQLQKKATGWSPPAGYLSLVGMSDDAVQAKTGRTWLQWARLLEAAGASTMLHRDIAKLLHDGHGLEPWWAQTVTVGYERMRGLRDIGQRRGGSYEINKSKTVAVALPALYRAFSVKRTRQRWLPVDLRIRRSTVNRSMRITWDDGTDVDVAFYAKSDGKSQVVIQHRDLPSKGAAEKLRAYWTDRLSALVGQLP